MTTLTMGSASLGSTKTGGLSLTRRRLFLVAFVGVGRGAVGHHLDHRARARDQVAARDAEQIAERHPAVRRELVERAPPGSPSTTS